MVVDEYSFARNALAICERLRAKPENLAVKPVLTGPYTLAKLSTSEGTSTNGANADRSSLEARTHAYAEIIAQEMTRSRAIRRAPDSN